MQPALPFSCGLFSQHGMFGRYKKTKTSVLELCWGLSEYAFQSSLCDERVWARIVGHGPWGGEITVEDMCFLSHVVGIIHTTT